MDLDVTSVIIEAGDADDARLWVRQIQESGGEIVNVERIDVNEYVVRALVPSQAALAR